MDIATLDISKINPTQKDFDRADGLEFHGHTFHGSGQPWAGEAAKMAKLIKDPIKLVRRAKAVVDRWGTQYAPYYSSYEGCRKNTNSDWDCWTPFKERLKEIGFTNDQIKEISTYTSKHVEEPEEVLEPEATLSTEPIPEPVAESEPMQQSKPAFNYIV